MGLLKVFEVFDSTINVNWEPISGNGFAGGFSVDGTKYIVQLTPISISDLDVLEASFHLFDVSGDKSFSSTGTSAVPTAVYGVVSNALIEKIPNVKCDAVFFSAERRHSKDDKQHQSKIKVYKFIARRVAKKLGLEIYVRDNEFLLTRKYIGPAIKSFKHWQEEIRESFANSTFPSLDRK